MKLKPFAFIIINNFLYSNTFYKFLYYYQNALQTPTPNAEFTRRLYSMHAARPQRAHSTLEDPTALPQCCHNALFNTLCKRQAVPFISSMLKTNAAAWRSKRSHSAHTALVATAQRAPRRPAFF